MKKAASLLFATILICLGAVLLPQKLHAQTLTAERAYQDYQYQLSNYLEAEASYEDAKTFYQKNPTLQLREEARGKTLTMLRDRDHLLVVYLTALRAQISETTGYTDSQKADITSRIDSEVAWYQDHIQKYSDADDLDTLFTKSDESKARYTPTTINVIDQSLFDITLSEQVGLRLANQTVYADLKSYINDLVAKGKITLDPFNRWLNDTDSVLNTLSNNEKKALEIRLDFPGHPTRAVSNLNKGLTIFKASANPLVQLNNYLTEMLTFLKNQNL